MRSTALFIRSCVALSRASGFIDVGRIFFGNQQYYMALGEGFDPESYFFDGSLARQDPTCIPVANNSILRTLSGKDGYRSTMFYHASLSERLRLQTAIADEAVDTAEGVLALVRFEVPHEAHEPIGGASSAFPFVRLDIRFEEGANAYVTKRIPVIRQGEGGPILIVECLAVFRPPQESGSSRLAMIAGSTRRSLLYEGLVDDRHVFRVVDVRDEFDQTITCEISVVVPPPAHNALPLPPA